MPDKSMNIDFRIRGVKRVGEAADNVKRLAKEVKNLQSVLGPGNTLAIGGGGFGGGRVGGGGSGGRVGSTGGSSGGSNLGRWTAYYGANLRNDPAAALNFANTMLAGDQFNPGLNSLRNRAQSHIEREEEKQRKAEERAKREAEREQAQKRASSFAGRFQRWGYSTRFGSTGTMPLVGQTLDLIGIGKLAGPIGAVVAGLGLFKEALDGSVKAAREQQQTYGIGGGTGRQIGFAQTISNLMGIDVSDFASRGRNLQDAYYANSDAGRALRELGVKAPGFGPGRDPNSTPWAIDAARKALALKDPNLRLKYLQDIGLPELADVGHMSWAQSERLNFGAGMDRKTRRDRMIFDASMRQLGQDFANNGLNPVAWGQTFYRQRLAEERAKILDKQEKSGGDMSVASRQLKELEKINQNLYVISGNTRKSFGNAALRGAIPEQWRLEQIAEDAALKSQIDMGAFEL